VVAAAGGAAKCVDGALLTRDHEVAAVVHGMPVDADRVVFEALPIPLWSVTEEDGGCCVRARDVLGPDARAACRGAVQR
jgi:hypothetical protein